MEVKICTVDMDFPFVSYYIAERGELNTAAIYLENGLIRCVFHSDTGPAIIDHDGSKFYYLHNQPITFEEWFAQLTPDQQMQALYNPDNF